VSIENNLAVIAKSLERIATAMEKGSTPTAPAATEALGNLVQAAAVATAPTPAAPVPTPAAPVAQTPSAPAAHSELPAGPSFMPQQQAQSTTIAIPFNDGKGLVDYVMGAYKAMGPEKGANIQGVLVSLGYQNINDVQAKDYEAVFKGVEALK
jgi:hypothetical protein